MRAWLHNEAVTTPEPNKSPVTDGAKALGVTRQALNNLVNEKTGIRPEMAIRLEKAFGSSADMWLKLQTGFELANARRHAGAIAVERYVRKTDPDPQPGVL